MQILRRKLWVLFGIAALGTAGFVLAATSTDHLKEFKEIGAELQQIKFDAPPPQSDGFSNLTETEWPFFSLVYWGYSGVNLAQTVPEAKAETLKQVAWALEKLQTPRVSGFIEPHFGPAFGDGFRTPSTLYHGHFLLLALRYREMSQDPRYDVLIHKIAKAFSEVLEREPSGILPSYRNLCWPSDTLPALARSFVPDELCRCPLSQLVGDDAEKIPRSQVRLALCLDQSGEPKANTGSARSGVDVFLSLSARGRRGSGSQSICSRHEIIGRTAHGISCRAGISAGAGRAGRHR